MNIEDVFQKYNIQTASEGNRHYRRGWLNIECPFCGKGTGAYGLGINVTFKYGNCYKCGPKKLWSIFSEILPNLNKRDLSTLISDIGGISSLELDKGRKAGKYAPPNGLGKLRYAHKAYLGDIRGLDWKELVRYWHIQGTAGNSELPWRIFIPIEYEQKAVSWNTRSINPDNPMRYYAAPEERESISAKSLLYGEDYVGTTIMVHEGAFDVWSIGPGSTCTNGLGYTRSQLLRISKYPKRYICFDNEPGAQRRARKLCRALAPFPGETENIQIDAKDVNDSSKSERKIIRKLIGR